MAFIKRLAVPYCNVILICRKLNDGNLCSPEGLNNLFICSCVCWLFHSFIFVSFFHSLFRSFTHSFIHSFFHFFLVSDTRLYTLPCPSVRRSVRPISELRAVFTLLPLPNRPRLSCRVSGPVFIHSFIYLFIYLFIHFLFIG